MIDNKKVSEIEVSYKPAIGDKPVVQTALDAYNILYDFYSADTISLQEKFCVMYLNKANRVLGVYPLSLGGLTSTVADIRLILGTGLKIACSSIIVSHNHPSNNLTPSKHDEVFTKRLKDACSYFDIEFLDHLIVGTQRQYLSMNEEGLMGLD